MNPTTTAMTATARSQEHRLMIAAPPATVWKAITEAEELVRWFPLQAESTPGAGGSLTYGWGPELTGICRIEVWEPPRHLRTSWMEATVLESGSAAKRRQLAVDWFIEGEGGRSMLRLVHSGFGRGAEWDEEYEGTRRGWIFELGSLKHYLERHAGRARRAFWLLQPLQLAAPQVWQRLTGPQGLVREGLLSSLRPGDRYRLVLAGGDSVEGTVQIHEPPFEFAGTAENLGDGLLRLGYCTTKTPATCGMPCSID